VREAHQGLHEGQLARVIELESGDSPPLLGLRRPAETPELAPIHEGLQDVLLGVQIAVEDSGGSLAQRR